VKSYHLEVAVEARLESSEDFESIFETLADALADCDGVMNADLAADTPSHVLTFEMDVAGGREAEALERGLVAVRTALHAAGGSTAEWEKHFRMLRQTVEVPSDEQAKLIQA